MFSIASLEIDLAEKGPIQLKSKLFKVGLI